MESIVLAAMVEADGGTMNAPQEIRLSLGEGGEIILVCSGLFKLRLGEQEFENLYECVGMLQKQVDDE